MHRKSVLSTVLCFVICAAVMAVTLVSQSGVSALGAAVNLNGKGRGFDRFGQFFESLSGGSKEPSEVVPETQNINVYLGGYPVGLKLYADGVVVVATDDVDAESGALNPAEKAGIKVGDIIKEIDGKAVKRNAEVSEIIERSGGETMTFSIERNGEKLSVRFSSEFSVSEQKYKAGLWVRDSSAGIGTVTFCLSDGRFASLGHAVCDIDTKEVIPIATGETASCEITGFIKGTRGTAGELCGYLGNERTGSVFENGDGGVYGKFDKPDKSMPSLQIAAASEITKGEATVYTTVESGNIEQFTVEITDINKSEAYRNLTLKVTDSAIIEKTGGIVQGMSGSPIVQNGKIVGAVTHVFVNDPTGGYGIFAESMLERLG